MEKKEKVISRRAMLKVAGGASLATVFAPMVNLSRYRLFANSSQTYSDRAVKLVGRSTVIDMLHQFNLSRPQRSKSLNNPATFTAADFERYKDSGVNVMNIGENENPDSRFEWFAQWNGFIAHHDQWFVRISDVADMAGAKATGKVGILLGTQNSLHFRRVDDVDTFHGLGQRVSQLTYNSRNLIGNGSTERRDDGLSDFGVQIVERMNAVGMAVDVSHCGDRTTLDAFEVAKRPVLITHANCRALNPTNVRCKTDEAIRKMAAKGE